VLLYGFELDAMALNGVWPPNVINHEVRGATRFPFEGVQ